MVFADSAGSATSLFLRVPPEVMAGSELWEEEEEQEGAVVSAIWAGWLRFCGGVGLGDCSDGVWEKEVGEEAEEEGAVAWVGWSGSKEEGVGDEDSKD